MKRKILIAFLAVTMVSIILFATGSALLSDRAGLVQIPTSGKIALLGDPSVINGTVTDAVTTLPIKGANVSAGGVSDLTDSEGHYDLTVAPSGWLVTVTRLGYFSQSKNATVAANATTTLNFALSPNPAEMGWIAGNVTNTNTSAPIAGATVEADGYSTTTNATGLYKMQVPAPWNYSVTASKIGFQDKTVNGVSVKAGNTTILNFELNKTAPQQIKAIIVVNPRSLNLRSNGRWISVSIELEKGFNVKDINVSSIKLNGKVSVDMNAPMEFGDSKLIVKFDRKAIENLILDEMAEPGKFSSITLTLTGKMKDGTMFTGNDTIKAIFNLPTPEAKMHSKKA